MGILARLVEGVNAADVGVLLALVWLVVRLEWTRSETAAAHAAITRNIDGVKRELTKDIDGVKQELNDVRQDVKKLLTGDVAWMQAVLQDRRHRE